MRAIKIENCPECPLSKFSLRRKRKEGGEIFCESAKWEKPRKIGTLKNCVVGKTPIPQWCPLEKQSFNSTLKAHFLTEDIQEGKQERREMRIRVDNLKKHQWIDVIGEDLTVSIWSTRAEIKYVVSSVPRFPYMMVIYDRGELQAFIHFRKGQLVRRRKLPDKRREE